MDAAKEVGQYIKYYRKKQKITIEVLAEKVSKSKSCISKYENGQIAIDVVTLYEIADALNIHVEQLLMADNIKSFTGLSQSVPAFFQNIDHFYLYYYDGRKRQICRSVVDILGEVMTSVYQVKMYMSVNDYSNYRFCETMYAGHISHYDTLSCIIMQNINMAMEQYQISIPHPYMNTSVKWGLAYGISYRPLMPTSTKVLISKTIQEETPDFEKSLRLSKEDIQLMKQYNMLTIQ